MSLNDANLAFSSNWDIDQLYSGYPKTVNITVPANPTYGTYFYGLLESFPSNMVLPSGYKHVAEGYFKSLTDGDIAWHQLGEAGWIPSTGGAKVSGANVFCALAVANDGVYIQAGNWNSGPGGASRDVTFQIRYHVYVDRIEY